MNRNFEQCLKRVLKHEGGYVDHPRDPGGATNKGITIATYRRYIKKGGTKSDLKKITTKQAGIVYKQRYWDKVRGDELPDGLDYAVFDFAVNSGPSRAVKFLQRSLGIEADGKFGVATMRNSLAADAGDIARRLCDNRLAWMRGLKTWSSFGKGWTRRVNAVKKESIKMAHEAPTPPPQRRIPPPAPKEVIKRVPVVPPGLDKPKAKSKSLWASWGIKIIGAIQFGAASTAGYFMNLDWKIQMALIGLIAAALIAIGLAFFMSGERNRYRKEAQQMLKDFGD